MSAFTHDVVVRGVAIEPKHGALGRLVVALPRVVDMRLGHHPDDEHKCLGSGETYVHIETPLTPVKRNSIAMSGLYTLGVLVVTSCAAIATMS